MDIVISPVDNGWLVTSKTAGTRKVFTDREAMMEHLNDIVPPSGDGQAFIDGIDAECDEDCEEDWDEDAENFTKLQRQVINNISKTQSKPLGKLYKKFIVKEPYKIEDSLDKLMEDL